MPRLFQFITGAIVHFKLIISSQYGWTPLHDAAQECNVLAVSYFIECGADVNIPDKVEIVK